MAQVQATEAERLKQQLSVWRRDVVRWAEAVLRVKRPDTGRIEPLRLEPHQKRWLQEATKRDRTGHLINHTVVASWPKREGKSLVVSILVAHRTACYTGQLSVILANSERQAASVIYDEIVGFFRNSPMLASMVTEDDVEVKRLKVPALGNEIQCVPCNYRTVQGISVTGILATDELHAVQDLRAYNFLAGQTEMIDAQVAISSQAGSPEDSNPMWRLYKARNEPGRLFDYAADHLTPWGRRIAEQQKAELAPAEYEMLHRNGWVGLGMKLFAAEDLLECAQDFDEPQTHEDLLRVIEELGLDGRMWTAGAGLDRAGVSASGDRSALTLTLRFLAMDDLPELYLTVRQWVFPSGSESEILAGVREMRELVRRPVHVICEYYNCVDIVARIDDAELASPSQQRQAQLFATMYRLVHEHRWLYPADAGWDWEHHRGGLLHSELVAFEHGRSGGQTKYGTQNGHDDTVYSGAWSIEAPDGRSTTELTAADIAVGVERYEAAYE